MIGIIAVATRFVVTMLNAIPNGFFFHRSIRFRLLINLSENTSKIVLEWEIHSESKSVQWFFVRLCVCVSNCQCWDKMLSTIILAITSRQNLHRLTVDKIQSYTTIWNFGIRYWKADIHICPHWRPRKYFACRFSSEKQRENKNLNNSIHLCAARRFVGGSPI